MTHRYAQSADEKSTLWKVPERNAYAESILTKEAVEDHLGADEKRPGRHRYRHKEAGRKHIVFFNQGGTAGDYARPF